ncbi:glycosyltransferase [Acinetobacter sp. PW68]|nr:glycosyltransferase [Acinetobacter sp. PW68]
MFNAEKFILKIVILSGANSIHTIRWANGLQEAGLEVYLISQHPLMHKLNEGIQYYELPNRGVLGYFLIVAQVKKLLLAIKPDIVNAHYASGYGTTARLVNYHPYVLSVWGSDIYLFPKKSFIHHWLVNKNLLAADAIASTSHCMALETNKLVALKKPIFITPFGIDKDIFYKERNYSASGYLSEDKIVIGTVKSLKPVYGIDLLIKSFAILYNKLKASHPQLAEILRLRIVGGGQELEVLQALAASLNIYNLVEFIGQVNHEQVPEELAKLDIYVALSRSESFGVAILEAGLNQCPVVVSNVSGLAEVVVHEDTGLIVESENINEASEALSKLVLNPELIQRLGANGQKYVLENYLWPVSIKKMVNAFNATIELKHSRNY